MRGGTQESPSPTSDPRFTTFLATATSRRSSSRRERLLSTPRAVLLSCAFFLTWRRRRGLMRFFARAGSSASFLASPATSTLPSRSLETLKRESPRNACLLTRPSAGTLSTTGALLSPLLPSAISLTCGTTWEEHLAQDQRQAQGDQVRSSLAFVQIELSEVEQLDSRPDFSRPHRSAADQYVLSEPPFWPRLKGTVSQ